MGEAAGAGAGASVTSIASLGLSAYSSVLGGEAKKSSYDFQADRAERAAQFGRLQAGLTDVTMREELNRTISNIDVIRSAARIDPTSPTTVAVEDLERMKSDRQRTAAVMTLRQQANEDDASAGYFRKAGDFAVSMGYLDAATKLASGGAKAAAG